MEFSSTGNGSSLGVQCWSPCSQTAERQANLLLVWGDMHSMLLSFPSSHRNLVLVGLLLDVSSGNFIPTTLSEKELGRISGCVAKSSLRDEAGQQTTAILSRDSTLSLMFLSLSFYHLLVQPPVFPTSPDGAQS